MLPNVAAYSFNYGKYHLGTYLIFLTHFGHMKQYSHSSTSKTQFHTERKAGRGVGRGKNIPFPLPLLSHACSWLTKAHCNRGKFRSFLSSPFKEPSGKESECVSVDYKVTCTEKTRNANLTELNSLRILILYAT